MKKFEVKLRTEGEITLLPDSQKLFGYLMNQLNRYYNEQEIDHFIAEINTKCMVSNLMPTGYLPTPKTLLMNEIQKRRESDQDLESEDKEDDLIRLLENEIKERKALTEKKKEKNSDKMDLEENLKSKDEAIKDFKKELEENANKMQSISSKEIYETIKRMDYIKKEDLRAMILKIRNLKESISVDQLDNFEHIVKKQRYVQKFKLESQEKRMPGYPNRAYSLPIVEHIRYGDGSLQKNFSFFVITEEDSILGKFLRKDKKDIDSLWMIGPKASSGCNCYSLETIEEFDEISLFSKDEIYINLGMLLPEKDSVLWDRSYITIFSSDRRAFEMSDDTKKVISFIGEGSVLFCKGKKTYEIGKSIRNEYNKRYLNAVVFGNSYLEPLEVSYD